MPDNARGIAVDLRNPFRSFLAAVIGHTTLQVRATAVHVPGWSSGQYALTALCRQS